MNSTSLLDGEDQPEEPSKISGIGKAMSVFAGVLFGCNSRSAAEAWFAFAALFGEAVVLLIVAALKKSSVSHATLVAFSVYCCVMAVTIPVTFWTLSHASFM